MDHITIIIMTACGCDNGTALKMKRRCKQMCMGTSMPRHPRIVDRYAVPANSCAAAVLSSVDSSIEPCTLWAYFTYCIVQLSCRDNCRWWVWRSHFVSIDRVDNVHCALVSRQHNLGKRREKRFASLVTCHETELLKLSLPCLGVP